MTTPPNPIATPDQHAFERRGLELFGHPRLVSTMREIEQYWIEANQPSDEMRACLEWAFEEVMFGAVIWSLNQDPLYPKVVTITRLRHKLGELQIPGTRWGIDNPDSVYRVIPISGDEEYVIRGKLGEPRLTENYFTLWDRQMGTVDVLNGKDLVLEADGSFAISVDSRPADGRPNHVRSSPEAFQFYIRDVVMDWSRERINELSIERLGGPPACPPLSDEEQLERTAEYMWNWVKDTIRWSAPWNARPENEFNVTIDRDTDGALRDQIYNVGRFRLKSSDEVMLLNIDLGGADYFIAPISNIWGTTNEIVDRTGSLNRAQSVPNPDGTYTYVLSVDDPGVHNWLDPSGLREGVLTLRWAEFPPEGPGESLSANSRVVPRSELRSHLPEGTRYVSAEERRAQLAERARGYAWRLRED
ncbi:MAG: hypothetical protein J4G09_01690 [Proteobacteria bacterium]|nr:hypothetical protein [Pseudomonadota bacterium]